MVNKDEYILTFYSLLTTSLQCNLYRLMLELLTGFIIIKIHSAPFTVTRCVVMPSRWVGQNSGPIFRRLWTKVHRIKFACAGVSVVCNAVFRLMMSCSSCCVPQIFAIKSRSCAKSRHKFDVFGPANSGDGAWGGRLADRYQTLPHVR